MTHQEQVVQRLARRLGALLAFRAALYWTSLALLGVGTVALILRLVFQVSALHLVPGLLLVLPLGMGPAFHAWRKRPAPSILRALIDSHNRYGGLLMAGEQAELGAWTGTLSPAGAPRLQWKSRRALLLFAIAAAYMGLILCLPERFTALAARRPLEVGKLVQELSAQLATLEQEKIIDPLKTEEIQRELNKLKEDSSGMDPAKTWEALDHLRQSTSESAQKSAEEALAKLETLSQAETLAAALNMVSPSNLNEQVSTQAMQELGSLLQNAKVDEGAMAGVIPPELLAALKTNGLSAEQLSQLMQAISSGKGRLGEALTNLANLKLIDASLVGKCSGACQGGNSNALAAFLTENSSTNLMADLQISYGRGGRDRGRGDAPMTWSEGTSEDDAQFKEQILPRMSSSSPEAQLVGVSRANPQLTDARESVASGALNQAARGGGSAQAQVILPRHKDAVRHYFTREP